MPVLSSAATSARTRMAPSWLLVSSSSAGCVASTSGRVLAVGPVEAAAAQHGAAALVFEHRFALHHAAVQACGQRAAGAAGLQLQEAVGADAAVGQVDAPHRSVAGGLQAQAAGQQRERACTVGRQAQAAARWQGQQRAVGQAQLRLAVGAGVHGGGCAHRHAGAGRRWRPGERRPGPAPGVPRARGPAPAQRCPGPASQGWGQGQGRVWTNQFGMGHEVSSELVTQLGSRPWRVCCRTGPGCCGCWSSWLRHAATTGRRRRS
jgi:hypothetical protein